MQEINHEIDIVDFYKVFRPIRNTLQLCSPLENLVFEADDDEQMEVVDSKDDKYIWTYTNRGELYNGRARSHSALGYIVCQIPYTGPKKEIRVIV